MISAIIPAYNEEDKIYDTVAALTNTGLPDEIIVVDDGSADATADAAAAAGAAVVRLPQNKGKAHALKEGVNSAHGDILCFVDADLGGTAGEFIRLIPPVVNGEADMTIAIFPKAKKKGGFGLVKGLACFCIERLGGYRAQSPLSGQRVLRRALWESACCLLTGYGVEVGLTVECLRRGFTLREIPVEMTHRETGRDLSGFYHRGRQFYDLLRTFGHLWRNRRVKV